MPRRAQTAVSVRDVDQSILPQRGERVLLGPDPAVLYGVDLRALTQSVRRNWHRFHSDFCLQLRPAEWASLKSQTAISSWGRSRGALPYAFTEQEGAMLSSVVRSPRAVAVNIEIVRALAGFRRSMAGHADVVGRLDELERKYDGHFGRAFGALRALMEPPPDEEGQPSRRIGFRGSAEEPR